MLFPRSLILLAFLFASVLTVLSRPVKPRDSPTVASISTTLQTSTGSILSQISETLILSSHMNLLLTDGHAESLADSKTATESNITPLTNDLIQALSTAKASLSGAQDVTNTDDISDIATIIEELIAVRYSYLSS